MTINASGITFHFPHDFDERAESEMEARGHLWGGEVELADGRRYPVTFFDPVRLTQDLESMTANGEPAFIEPGLIVVMEVTREAIARTLPELVRQRFFDHMRPLTPAGANGVAK